MIINNKEVLQSYILTTAKYDYTVYEKRILYRIVELLQAITEGKKLNLRYSVQVTTLEDYDITMPISAVLADEQDENYTRVKNAFTSLQKKIIQYEDKKSWQSLNLLERPKIIKDGGNSVVSFRLSPLIAECFMDFSKGYRKYELATAMLFQSEYSMRFYELFSNQAKPINYSIENLKEMFGISDKYVGRPADFIKRVVIPAKKELDEKSPYTFIYKELKTGRKITSLQFIPIYQAGKENQGLKAKKLGKQISTRFYLEPTEKEYLMAQYAFTEKEIKNNCDLFEGLYQVLEKGELMDKLADLRRFAGETNNPKGYVIKSLKTLLDDTQNALLKKKQAIKKGVNDLRAKENQSLADVLAKFK